MADSYDRKPPAPEDDEPELYELAEDPDDLAAAPPPPPGILPGNVDVGPHPPPAPSSGGEIDPMADDEPIGGTGSRGEGGTGGASHFSGEDPEYVNPEIARIRREEQRVARAAEEAAEAAKKQKIILGVVVAVIVLVVLLVVIL